MGKLVWNAFTDNLDYTQSGGGGVGSGFTSLAGNVGSIVPTAGGVGNIVGSGAITVTSTGPNTLTITTGNPFFTWQVITASQVAKTQNGYFTFSGGPTIQLQLPATSVVGDTFQVAAMNFRKWQITQINSQSIIFGNAITKVGAGGYLMSSLLGDSVELVCNIGTLEAPGSEQWVVVDAVGTDITVN